MPKKIGRYEILGTLGEGAMGIVYKARDPKFSRIVALKAIHSAENIPEKERTEFFQRFCREAHAAGSLPHPNIVTIFDADKDPSREVSFITMEYVEGMSLEDLLVENGTLSADQAMDITIQVAKGLGFAHSRGVVHRDIKPANILLDGNGTVRISDFGIAKVSTSKLTTSGQFLGTPCYMSPEQVFGDDVDGRSDLFSLTVVLYQLLTGELPFPGNNITTITYKIVNTEPPPPTHINFRLADGFDDLIARGLAKKPAERFQSAEELITELKLLQRKNAPACAPVAPPEQQGEATGQRTLVAVPVFPSDTPPTVNSRDSQQLLAPAAISRTKRPAQTASGPVSMSRVLIGVLSGLSALLLTLFIYPRLAANDNQPRVTPPPVSMPKIVKTYDLASLSLAADTSPVEWPIDLAVEHSFPAVREVSVPAVQKINKTPAVEEELPPAEETRTETLEAIDDQDDEPAGMLNLVFRHPFVSGQLRIYADNQPVYESPLGQSDGENGKVKKKLKVLGRKLKLANHQANGIRIPVGRYDIEVEVVRPDGSVLPRASLAGDFEEDEERSLSILCSRKKSKELTLEWNSAK